MKPALIIISLLLCTSAYAQYGREDTSGQRRPEANLSKDAIKVFPNPVRNDLYITIRMSGLLIKHVLIYDKDGHRVLEQKINSILPAPVKINTSRLKPGLYYLVLETNKQPYRTQVIRH